MIRPGIKHPARYLAAAFFLSGLAGLIYQVAWQRLLTVHYGVGAVSIAVIVSVYMFGLGLGSLLGGRLAERCSDPCALYAIIEGALGIAGLASFPVILALGRITSHAAPAVSFVCMFAFLCLPTLLMGITLPLLTALFVRMTGDFIYSVAHLYFINTLGAAAGAVLTSYLFISLVGLDGSIYLAAVVDFVLASAIFLVRGSVGPELQREREADPFGGPGMGRLAHLLVFATGFIAIGYEIICYRVIGVLVKDSPYAFSSVLAIYLMGIACGSLAVRNYLARNPNASRRDLFFTVQFLIGLTILLTFAGYYQLSQHGPVQRLTHLSFSADAHPSLAVFSRSPDARCFDDIFLLLDVFLWPMAFLLMPTMLMGASFPLISSLALSRRGGEGTAVGTTYFFGVMGNVLGGLVTGLLSLPLVGTEVTALALGSLALLFGLAPRIFSRELPGFYRLAGLIVLLLGIAAIFPRPGSLYMAMHEPPFPPRNTEIDEGLDAVVLTYANGELLRNFINGQGHGYRPGPPFYAEAVESLSFTPIPRKVLVIGFGAGSITEACLKSTEVQQVTLVELCGSVIGNLRKFPALVDILDDKRLRLIIDDGRRFLQRNDERFDVILMDALRTTTAYSNNLHSRQFFALAGQHLSDGGVLMVGGVGDSPVIPRTLLEEFSNVRSYYGFSLASKVPLRKDTGRFERLLPLFPAGVQTEMRAFLQDYKDGQELVKVTRGYPPNQDWKPVSEYYLGLHFRNNRTP